MHLDAIAPSARLIFGLCALGLVSLILAMIRKNAIKEKYALLWLPLGFGFLGMSLFPDLLLDFSARVHLHYMTVVMLGVIVVFTVILLYFTVRMSQMREDVKKLSQEIALLRVKADRAMAGAGAGDRAGGKAGHAAGAESGNRDVTESGTREMDGETDTASGWVPAGPTKIAADDAGSARPQRPASAS